MAPGSSTIERQEMELFFQKKFLPSLHPGPRTEAHDDSDDDSDDNNDDSDDQNADSDWPSRLVQPWFHFLFFSASFVNPCLVIYWILSEHM